MMPMPGPTVREAFHTDRDFVSATRAGKDADAPIRQPYNGRMEKRIPVAPGKACLLLNHGPVTLVRSALAVEGRYDLFLGEVLAAWVAPRQFSDGRWHFAEEDGRTIHYCAGARFFATGDAFEA